MSDNEDRKHQLGDAPIQSDLLELMNGVARGLDDVFNPGLKAPHKKIGFVLLVFPFGSQDGRANYISNGADRADICTLFREQIARLEGRAPADMKPEHKQ